MADGFDIIKFKEKLYIGGKTISQAYLISVPKGGILRKVPTGDSFKEYRISFSDSSIVYITNDNWSGSRLNFENRYNNNIKTINKKSENDTLILVGVQGNGRLWKEKFVGDIVVGYFNVKPEEKEKFDQSLSTVRKY